MEQNDVTVTVCIVYGRQALRWGEGTGLHVGVYAHWLFASLVCLNIIIVSLAIDIDNEQ